MASVISNFLVQVYMYHSWLPYSNVSCCTVLGGKWLLVAVASVHNTVRVRDVVYIQLYSTSNMAVLSIPHILAHI